MTPTEVQEHLTRWRDGRANESLSVLLKWQRNRAYAISASLLGAGAEAEDAVQQAFVKLLSRTHGFDSPDDFKVAVYRAVVQCAIDLRRSLSARNRAEKNMPPPRSKVDSTPDSVAEKKEALVLLRDALTELPEQQQAMVVLCCQEGLSLRAAADAMGMKRETLRDHLKRSLMLLRRKLSQRGVMLSFVGLIGLFKSTAAVEAPTALLTVLDASLSGVPCAAVKAAGIAVIDPSHLVVEAGLSGATAVASTTTPMVASLVKLAPFAAATAACVLVVGGLMGARETLESPTLPEAEVVSTPTPLVVATPDAPKDVPAVVSDPAYPAPAKREQLTREVAGDASATGMKAGAVDAAVPPSSRSTNPFGDPLAEEDANRPNEADGDVGDEAGVRIAPTRPGTKVSKVTQNATATVSFGNGKRTSSVTVGGFRLVAGTNGNVAATAPAKLPPGRLPENVRSVAEKCTQPPLRITQAIRVERPDGTRVYTIVGMSDNKAFRVSIHESDNGAKLTQKPKPLDSEQKPTRPTGTPKPPPMNTGESSEF